MLSPKRTKFRKQQKGRNRGLSWTGSDIDFGDFAVQALEAGRLTSRQIEAGRMAITRKVKRQGKLWIRVFPDKPITKKPLEVRMGSGKGAVDHWVAVIKPGRVLFELAGVSEAEAREAFKVASAKLPLSTRFLTRTDVSRVMTAGAPAGGKAAP